MIDACAQEYDCFEGVRMVNVTHTDYDLLKADTFAIGRIVMLMLYGCCAYPDAGSPIRCKQKMNECIL